MERRALSSKQLVYLLLLGGSLSELDHTVHIEKSTNKWEVVFLHLLSILSLKDKSMLEGEK